MVDGNPGPTPEAWLYSPWQRQANEDLLALTRIVASSVRLRVDDSAVLDEIIERRGPQEGTETE